MGAFSNAFSIGGLQRGAMLKLLPDEVLVVKQIFKKVFYSENTTALGFVIPNVTGDATWATAITLYNNAYAAQSGTVEQKTYAGVKAAAMYCDNENLTANSLVYGKLYNWFAIKLIQMDFNYAIGSRYRCSNYFDWKGLSYNLGGDAVAGGHIKESGLTHWNSPNTGADNSSGMSVLAAGQRAPTGGFSPVKSIGRLGFVEQISTDNFRWAFLSPSSASLTFITENKRYGLSLMLIKKTKKLVTIGDSITFQSFWQPSIIAKKGYECSIEEITLGKFGYRPMGVGSSRIIPLINDAYVGQQVNNSIYERCDDVKYYNPDTILLFGGQNDVWTGANSVLGTIDDAAYTGVGVTSNAPTFYSSYKGCIKKLIEQNITSRIVCVSPLYATDSTVAQKQLFVTAIQQCATLYNLTFIDLLNNVPINADNHATYLADGVHPNQLGADLIG